MLDGQLAAFSLEKRELGGSSHCSEDALAFPRCLKDVLQGQAVAGSFQR